MLDEGIRVAALSNATFSASCIHHELEKHDLAHYFELVISSADIGIRKPDQALFALALNKLKLASSQVRYIGDHWNNDIVGANSADILPIHFSSKVSASKVSASIDTSTINSFKYYRFAQWRDFPELWADITQLN